MNRYMVSIMITFLVSLSHSASAKALAHNPYLETILVVSKQTGTPAAMLMAIADKETNFRNIKAKNGGSAGGLYQFTDKTWKYLVDKHGERYQVGKQPSKYSPYEATLMACAYLDENAWILEDALQRTPTHSELYLSHLLGPTGAITILTAPANATAKEVVEYAYPRNKRLFHGRFGKLHTVEAFITQRHKEFTQLMDKYQQLPSLEQLPANHAIGI